MSKEFKSVEDKLKKTEFKNWEIHYRQVESAKKQELSASAMKEAELNEMRERAYAEGFTQGQEAAKKEIDDLKEQLQYWINVFSHPSEQIEQSIKAEVVDTIYWVCKHCIQVELSINPEKIQKIVEDALQALPSLRDGKKLFVNDEDLEWIEEQLLPKDREMILAVASKDATLARGDFYMRDDQSEVDGRLETRLNNILRQHLPQNDDKAKG
ncbi:FliH/SctL family protein [Legionella sp. W05-934-2]|jgi:flagellar assembly protein FliH|uniref:FliH/SctL family protein n=1 Tax=Legionella sp. W05-934-2 TaxID=1198649 RepID=UPI003461AE17